MEHILEETLSTILIQLADFFGTTTAAIQDQLPYFLAEYGRYYTLTEIPGNVCCGTIIGAFFCFGWAFFYCGILELPPKKSFVIVVVIIAIITCFLAIGIPIITCLMTPELVGVEALISELKPLTP